MVVDVLALLIGTAVIYALGVSWLKVATDMSIAKSFAVGALPFLLGDVIKIAAAVSIAKVLRPTIAERLLIARTT